MKPTQQRGYKIFLDKENTIESSVNRYLECRDGIVSMIEYTGDAGYGSKERIFICEDSKHDSHAIIKQVYSFTSEKWIEDEMYFDVYEFEWLVKLLTGKEDFPSHVKYELLRDFTQT